MIYGIKRFCRVKEKNISFIIVKIDIIVVTSAIKELPKFFYVLGAITSRNESLLGRIQYGIQPGGNSYCHCLRYNPIVGIIDRDRPQPVNSGRVIFRKKEASASIEGGGGELSAG